MALAHEIRNTGTARFQSVNILNSQHRWCITGTPIQNTLEDLGALVAFLKVPVLENKQTFRKYITPRDGSYRPGRYNRLRILLEAICLRRTRQLLNVPKPVTEIREVVLSDDERREYSKIIDRHLKARDLIVAKHGTGSLSAADLKLTLRLRLFCNNGQSHDADSGMNGLPTDPDELLSYLQQCEEANCVYCCGNIWSLSSAQNPDGGHVIPSCSHLVCHLCMPQFHQGGKMCPAELCATSEAWHAGALLRHATTRASNIPSAAQSAGCPEQDDGVRSVAKYPSKLRALLKDLDPKFGMRGSVEPKRYDRPNNTVSSMQ